MAFANAIKYNRVRSMKGLPIGAIVPWASDQSTVPTGWIVCNGATISNTRYPILFSVIGNTYGGTVGSTYRLPPLTSGQSAIVDVFRGHYEYFKGSAINALPGNEVNLPSSTTLANDPFWSIVGFGNNGNTGSNTQTVWLSTIDVVGEQVGRPTFPALYDDMTINDGSYSFTVTYTGTSLGANHMPPHTHSLNSDDATSWRREGGEALECTGTTTVDTCRQTCSSTSAWRVAANPNSATRLSRGNRQEDLVSNFLFFDARIGLGGTGGGGNIRGVPRFDSGGRGESGATVYTDGNGVCSGAMGCGGDILFTSLSNDATNNSAAHFHGPNNYNLQGRYNVISPGLRNNISLNTVSINNAPGQNFCTINADTATPSLEMLYIIRAF